MIINNLFSIFDPSTSTISISWISMLFPIAVVLQKSKIQKISITLNLIIAFIIKEVRPIIRNNKKGIKINSIILFISIIVLNVLALIPFTFTITAQIIFVLPIRLSIWTAINIFGWKNNTKIIIAHTLPTGTPIALINFIIIIEIVSNIIRPITLSVRLCANIVAGHLLINLLRNFRILSISNIIVSIPILIILITLETGVALIQAYVFIILISLYKTEILYEK